MKILYLITKSEAGGAQTHVCQLSQYFHAQNNEVTVMAYPGGWLEEECRKMGIRFVPNLYFSNSLNPYKVWQAVRLVNQLIDKFQPDIVHCHSSGAGFVGRLAVKNKIPTFFTAHGWGFNIGVTWWQKWLAILVEKYVSKYCEKIICVSDFVKDLGLKYKIAGDEKFTVIYNGIESEVQKSVKSKVSEKIKIIFVGRLAEPKDPLILIKACQELPVELKNNVAINIVGDGPKRKELELFLQKNKIENVNLSGSLSRERVFDIMVESDIFVLVSKYEGLPMTILEAMSFGLPVVASDVGGIKEVVKDGETGFLLKNNSVEELYLVLHQLLTNDNLRLVVAEKGRQKIQDEFSNTLMLKRVEELYLSKN